MSFSGIMKKIAMRHPGLVQWAMRRIRPELLDYRARQRVVGAFRLAAKHVPAYKQFLAEKGLNPADIKTFDDFEKRVPVIDKKSYVLPHQNQVAELCVGGKLDNVAVVMTSSGYTGEPTYWLRSHDELDTVALSTLYGFRNYYKYHKRHTLVLNCLYIGIYIAGYRFAQAVQRIARHNTTIANPGIDFDMALSVLKKLHPYYEQIILVGFPPFIKALAEKAIGAGVPLDKKTVQVVVGGEGFSEAYRTYLAKLLNIDLNNPDTGTILSTYGAADLDLNLFFETPETLFIRRVADEDDELRRMIFGDDIDTLPMFFQYVPVMTFVENADPEGEESGQLIITTSNTETKMPLIRYNIHDIGQTIPYRHVMECLDKRGIKMARKPYHMPFVTLVGRKASISFNGANIYPEYIQDAIMKDDEMSEKLTGLFHLRVDTDKSLAQRIFADLQLKENVPLNEGVRARCEELIYRKLMTKGEYREGIEKIFGAEGRPHVVFHLHDEYPYNAPHRIKTDYMHRPA
jgi:phenylacetate-CoA ligase